MKNILSRPLRNGRLIRGVATFKEMRSLPATPWMIEAVGHNLPHFSKTKSGECMNEYCTRKRMHCSRHCSVCSGKFNKINKFALVN